MSSVNEIASPFNNHHVVGEFPWDDDRRPPNCVSLPELLDHQAEERPESPALVAGDTRLSYRELATRSHRFAAALQDLGVTSSTRIALLATNTAEWIIAAFGTMRLGAAVNTFNTWARGRDLQYLLEAAEAQVLITVPNVRSTDVLGELRTLIPELWEPADKGADAGIQLNQLIVIGDPDGGTEPPRHSLSFSDIIRNRPDDTAPPNQATAESTAYVVYTSGTTSAPKAVPLAHRKLIENGFAIGQRIGLGPDDRVWLNSPLFWSFGGANAAMATFTHGACLVLQEQFTPEDAARIMAEEQCTTAYLLPSIAIALAEKAGPGMRANRSLRKGVTIGRPDEIERVAVELGVPSICNVYGSTEVYGNCCVTPHTMPLEERLVSQGPPLPGVELRIVDEATGAALPADTPGEIQVRGRVTTGYVGNATATENSITAEGWYRTGDNGIIRPDGTLEFLSRNTDMIKTSGINVSPLEVESFIQSHDSVEEVAVVGASHPTRDEVPVAFVVLIPGANATGDEIRKYCKKYLSGYKVPWIIDVVDELPQTSTGKLVRRSLRQAAYELVEQSLRKAE